MSNEVESLPGVHTPAELAAALTYIGPVFTAEALDPEGHAERPQADHPVTNEHDLAESYQLATGLMPPPSEGKQGVALIVGNGAFETAAQLIPVETPIIMCDVNAANLLTQRIILETVRNAPTAIEFLKAIGQFSDDYVGLPTRVNEKWAPLPLGERYRIIEQQWASQSIPYFLQSQQAYETAREALMQRAIGFRHIDLRDFSQHDAFAADLADLGAEVTLLNATNAFDLAWAGPDCGVELAERLPFHSNALVMDSSANFLRSQVYRLDEWTEHNEKTAKANGFRRTPEGWVYTKKLYTGAY